MSTNDRQKGRADYAAGTWNPPRTPFMGLFSSSKEVARVENKYQNYREGWHGKKSERRK